MESLRLYPPATSLERVASEDYVLGNTGIKIKKGQLIHFPTYAIHRDPENFPEPNSFKPERFLPENRTHHPYAHLPFGAGPRNCVGMRLALLEVKLALIHSVYKFKFSTTTNTSVYLYLVNFNAFNSC
jgi:cytochrome P450 family 3 subfamily A